MVRSNTYYGRYGLSYIGDALLANVSILGVKRHGMGYDRKATMPAGDERKFYYEQATGKIWFSPDQPFTIDASGSDVFVFWKE